MVIVQFLRPNVVQLAVAESGVLARKAHVSQLKKYCLSVADLCKVMDFVTRAFQMLFGNREGDI